MSSRTRLTVAAVLSLFLHLWLLSLPQSLTSKPSRPQVALLLTPEKEKPRPIQKKKPREKKIAPQKRPKAKKIPKVKPERKKRPKQLPRKKEKPKAKPRPKPKKLPKNFRDVKKIAKREKRQLQRPKEQPKKIPKKQPTLKPPVKIPPKPKKLAQKEREKKAITAKKLKIHPSSQPKKLPSAPKIRTLAEYRQFLERENATAMRNLPYLPPIRFVGSLPPKGAVLFFGMQPVVLKRKEIFQREKSVLFAVDPTTEEVTLVRDPAYPRRFSSLSFPLRLFSDNLYHKIAQSYPQLRLRPEELTQIALVPQKAGALFDWKCWKTIQRAHLRPEEVAAVYARFRKVRQVWILEVVALKLFSGKEIPVRDFEVEMLSP